MLQNAKVRGIQTWTFYIRSADGPLYGFLDYNTKVYGHVVRIIGGEFKMVPTSG